MGEEKETQPKERPTLNINWNKTWHTTQKITPYVFLLIAIILSAYLRSTTYRMPITEDWATQTIENQAKNQALQQTLNQYPNLPQEKRDELTKQLYTDFLNQNKQNIAEQKRQISQYFKERFYTQNQEPMLLDIDSYAYYRSINNLIEYGQNGNTRTANGAQWDSFVPAPQGGYPGDNLNQHLGKILYRFTSSIFPNSTSLTAAYWLPFLVAILIPIPAFFIGKILTGNIGAIALSLAVAIQPEWITRTSAGVPDTDVYTIFFPFLITWLILEAYKHYDMKEAKA